MDKKYGLQLRVKPQQSKPRPPLPNPVHFRDDSDDEGKVEREIARQASKKSLKVAEEQHKKALEEDPSAFDYDGVYDDMKQKAARPITVDREGRKPKYISVLIEKADRRRQEQEIVYERKLAKERSQDDHLYSDKPKFITSAYKKKLAEQAKWEEEERLRQLREEKEDVTKKTDITDFYFGLHKNVAFGGGEGESRKSKKQREELVATSPERVPPSRNSEPKSPKVIKHHENDRSLSPREHSHEANPEPVASTSTRENDANEPTAAAEQPKENHNKRSHDALAEAKQRFLARKKAKDQQHLEALTNA